MNELREEKARYIFAASPGVNPSLVRSSLKFIAELREQELYVETEPKKLMPASTVRYSEVSDVVSKKRFAPSFVICAVLAVVFAVVLEAWWLLVFTPLFIWRGTNYVIIIKTTANTATVIMSARKAPLAEFECELLARIAKKVS